MKTIVVEKTKYLFCVAFLVDHLEFMVATSLES